MNGNDNQGIPVDTSEFYSRIFAWLLGAVALSSIIVLAILVSPIFPEDPKVKKFLSHLASLQGLVFLTWTTQRDRQGPFMIKGALLVYAAFNGATLCRFIHWYTLEHLSAALLLTSAAFALACVFGHKTSLNLGPLRQLYILFILGNVLVQTMFPHPTKFMILVLMVLYLLLFLALSAHEVQNARLITFFRFPSATHIEARAVNLSFALYSCFSFLFIMHLLLMSFLF